MEPRAACRLSDASENCSNVRNWGALLTKLVAPKVRLEG